MRVSCGKALLLGLMMAAVLMPSGVSIGSPSADAATELVTLKRLGTTDVILLPTTNSKRIIQFSKPKTWQLTGKSQLYVEFQHSIELLPERSFLEISINDHALAHIPLTSANAPGSKLTIPLPVAALKDFNTLAFNVQQHYTNHCEDPLDKSLWTQILPVTQLRFDYAPSMPQVNLSAYPYPIIDSLSYSPPVVQYVIPKDASEETLNAMADVNVHLAQQTHRLDLQTSVRFGTPASATANLIYIGKASVLPVLAQLPGGTNGISLQSGRWTQNGKTLAEDQGVLILKGTPAKSILIVSGNSDKAVLKAAQYLTTRPKIQVLAGTAFVTPSDWSPGGNQTAKVPAYIDSQTRSFSELGFKTLEVHKINAPPIVYNVPVVSSFRRAKGHLWLDLSYSYSAWMNPQYSSLEVSMNNISIANIPLTNQQGETSAHASIPISEELIHPRNTLVAQFHMMPDKYGFCVDNYVDNAWGKIFEDSRLRVEGPVNSALPDAGLLNDTMYPYSVSDNLDQVELLMVNHPDPSMLNAMLGFTTRLGRATLADTDLRLNVHLGNNIDGGRNIAVFQKPDSGINLPVGAHLNWKLDGSQWLKRLALTDPVKGEFSTAIQNNAQGATLEQYQNGGNHVITVFTASSTGAFESVHQLFEDDTRFETLNTGLIQQLTTASLQTPNGIQTTAYHQELRDKAGVIAQPWWQQALNWLKRLPLTLLIGGLLGLFCLLVLLPLLVRRLVRS